MNSGQHCSIQRSQSILDQFHRRGSRMVTETATSPGRTFLEVGGKLEAL